MIKATPSAKDLIAEAEKLAPRGDINQIHFKTYALMLKHRNNYYAQKLDMFLKKLGISTAIKKLLKKSLLAPVQEAGIEYSNIMEEMARRASQTFQVISGNIAELCVERELNRVGLKYGVHYDKRKERTDFILYYPTISNAKSRHRIEVKNVKLRERGTRGLAFDGDTMIGFFDDPAEFTESNTKIIEGHCKMTGGFCYMPPQTLAKIKYKSKRLKSNIEFAGNALYFIKRGKMPT